MPKIIIGRQKKTMKNEEYSEMKEIPRSEKAADYLTLTGLCTMCLMLVISMAQGGDYDVNNSQAVAVMSSAVEISVFENGAKTVKEELDLPDKKTSAVDDSSIFEEIGEFFASLILGE